MNAPRPLSPGSLTALSVRASIAAGFPSPCADHAVKRIDLNEHLFLNPNASYLFRVSGDSMVEAGIFDGDTLIVDRSIEPLHNHIVVAMVDNDFTVKRLYRKQGLVRLMPENPKYEPIDLEAEQELRIFGVATWNLHTLFSKQLSPAKATR